MITELHELDSVEGITAVREWQHRSFAPDQRVQVQSVGVRERCGYFLVGTPGLQIVTEHALPVRFLAIMERVPVPVFDHIGSGRDMGVDVQPKLAVVGRKQALRIPSNGVGIGFGDEVIRVFQRTSVIPRRRKTTHRQNHPGSRDRDWQRRYPRPSRRRIRSLQFRGGPAKS